jgi:flagellar motor switch protein FliN/FliY
MSEEAHAPTTRAGQVSHDSQFEASSAAAARESDETPIRDGLGALRKVSVELSVEVARTIATVGDVLALRPGSTVPLHRPMADRLDVFVAGKLVATGEAVDIDDQLGVRIVDVSPGPSSSL